MPVFLGLPPAASHKLPAMMTPLVKTAAKNAPIFDLTIELTRTDETGASTVMIARMSPALEPSTGMFDILF